MSVHTAVLRLALRDVLAAKGRSLLVVAMIGSPVGALVLLAHLRGGSEGYGPLAFGGEYRTAVADAVNGLVLAMVVLQIVLLAGPAFAVGLRRQRLLLARLAAAGGTPGHLRAVVLAAGLALGLIAAALGTVLGLAGSVVLRETLLRARWEPTEIPAWTLHPGAIVFAVALAILSALAAAYLPARQAGLTDPAAVLAGRVEQPRVSRGAPILGVLLVLAGLGFTWVTLWRLNELGPALGAVPVVLGFVLLTPAVVAGCARFAGRLPLPLRIAVRDAGRHRSRTAPAVAAVMATVAAFTALGIGMASDEEQNRVEYVPRVAHGATLVGGFSADLAGAAEAAAAQALPGVTLHRLAGLDESEIALTPECGCGYYGPEGLVLGTRHYVGGPETAALLLGRDDPVVHAALARGEAVVFQPGMIEGGHIRFHYEQPSDPGVEVAATPGETPKFPATLSPQLFQELITLLPPALAERTGLPVNTRALLVTAPLTDAQTARLTAAVAPFGTVSTERGHHADGYTGVVLALSLVAAFLVLAGTLTATGLAAADSRPDVATLAVLGARPRTVRLVRAGQAAFVALLGCALGLLAGLPPGIAVARPLTAGQSGDGPLAHGPITEIPWLTLGSVCLAVTLLAALLAALFASTKAAPPRRLT
ncbi:hypothetical protein LO762_03670 [Actinocorallia sp. API 0066]|uniref:FtsX-like permease family protein n=1 Tax=Actinocorallia sp. API 0066 TaxID=2896846 RepID=UPI001E439FD9|nr:FtsX-like permease family protein [Actinocorallia sp. API 0066]MCD0448298.1 hypothetical protein [Actinocorallia sp. API 0066]